MKGGKEKKGMEKEAVEMIKEMISLEDPRGRQMRTREGAGRAKRRRKKMVDWRVSKKRRKARMRARVEEMTMSEMTTKEMKLREMKKAGVKMKEMKPKRMDAV